MKNWKFQDHILSEYNTENAQTAKYMEETVFYHAVQQTIKYINRDYKDGCVSAHFPAGVNRP